MRRLIFSKRSTSAHAIEPGDLCLALPPPEQRLSSDPNKLYLATVVKGKRVVFFDDGAEREHVAAKVVEATPADRLRAKDMYELALDEAKAIAAADSEDVVTAAIDQVKSLMGGSLGDDGMISYTFEMGEESKEGQHLCEALIANFGALARESPALVWMSTHWRDVCAAADHDASGTISIDEAIEIWDRVSSSIGEAIIKKLDILGAPPRLYRGDLCMALPCASDVEPADPARRFLATYVDATHVVYFDGPEGKVAPVAEITHVTPAAKERAILRYTKAVAQCKAAARKPTDTVVKAAIENVKESMGGTLGKDNAINYRNDAGDEAKEGQILCEALVSNFGALKAESKAVAEIASNWKVACAQADEDDSGTISYKEVLTIWDRIIVEMTRTCTSKLDKLGINPVPHVLSQGDLCMIKPVPGDHAGHSDPSKYYLAVYIDETHASFFDSPDDAPVEVEKVGPASAADRDVAVVKYSQALSQCMRLAQSDSAEVVKEAIEEVEREATLGKDGKINYRKESGMEAREGQLLCEALISNLGALWDESRALRHMMDHWRDVCAEVDEDQTGDISHEQAVMIWSEMLRVFMQFVAGKLERLGAAKAKKPSVPTSAQDDRPAGSPPESSTPSSKPPIGAGLGLEEPQPDVLVQHL